MNPLKGPGFSAAHNNEILRSYIYIDDRSHGRRPAIKLNILTPFDLFLADAVQGELVRCDFTKKVCNHEIFFTGQKRTNKSERDTIGRILSFDDFLVF